MCVSIVSVCDATKALLPGSVPNLKLHLDAVNGYHLILQTDGISCTLIQFNLKLFIVFLL